MISNQPHSDRPGESREQQSAVEAGAGRMKEHMRSLAEDAREKGRSIAERRKHEIAQTLRHVCEALHTAADKLHDQHDDTVADYTEAISERLDNAADYVERVDVAEILENVEQFARRQPHIFLGGMFLAGLAAARFLKASPPSHQRQFTSGQSGVPGVQGPHSGPQARGQGGMEGAAARQQRVGGTPPRGPSQGGPVAAPPSGATFPTSSEPIPGPRPAEPARGESGIGGSSRSQESRPGTTPESQSQQRQSEHQKREVDQ